MEYIKYIRNYVLFHVSDRAIHVTDVISAIVIVLGVMLAYRFLVKPLVKRILEINSVDKGRQYAATQIIKYLFYLLATTLVLDNIGLDISFLLAGSAALLVGIGIGLQQIFNDLVSGLILLFDGSVQVGDMVDINGMIGTVNKIGIRTSIIETRDHIKVIVPNSKFVTDSIVNWSHSNRLARFNIEIGVAYGSDLQLVKKCLLETLDNNPYVLETPAPEVQFKNFGNSSLDFELLFWSRNFWNIETIKSDVRFGIDRIFRENKIEIPFPQSDIHIRSSKVDFGSSDETT